MSSRASAKSPTPGSSASSKQPVKSLAEELEGAPMAVDSDDEVTLKKETYEKLRNRVKKGDEDIAKIQGMYNNTAAELQGLKEMIQELGNGPQRILDLENEVLRLGGQGNNPTIQELKNEVNTLRAAANIVTTPAGGRQKLKLSPPMTYDGTPGYLKGFLIQVKNYQNFHHGDFTNQTEKVVHAATYLRGRALKWFEPIQEEFLKYETLDECSTETRDIYSSFSGFEEALRSLFQDPDEKRQAERELAHLRQNKSTKDYAAMFRQLCVQLDLTEETKIFMFYQGLKDEVKDEIIKVDRP
ncbi:reverse transcriptase domain protein, partial [Colletotrichum chrysophilum]